MALSLLRIVRHSYRPHTGVLTLGSNKTWTVVSVAPGVVTEPGLVLYRFGASLFYANAARFADEILELIGPTPSAVRWVVVDAEAITNIDYSAARAVMGLAKRLAEEKIALGFARLPQDTGHDFDRHHLSEIIAPSMIFDRIHDSLSAFDRFKESLSHPDSTG